MRIKLVEIGNFRKHLSTRVELAAEQTVFVGANNSGKTSAMVALRAFLVARERTSFSVEDIPLCHWSAIDAVGDRWCSAAANAKAVAPEPWSDWLPFIDVWLDVSDSEFHFVQKIIPTLDWAGGLLGVRLRLEPTDEAAFRDEYVSLRKANDDLLSNGEAASKNGGDAQSNKSALGLWPTSLLDYLRQKFRVSTTVRALVLDPTKLTEPTHGIATPQTLPIDTEPVDGDPLAGLIFVSEIPASRWFSNPPNSVDDETANANIGARRLSEQLRSYYNKHLDPFDKPTAADLDALRAIESAQTAFNERLENGFDAALKELQSLGYPGVANPRLTISTKLRPVEGLAHDAAIQYAIGGDDNEAVPFKLPENSNGLGFQNLISVVFRLMAFRDAWMRVGKASESAKSREDAGIPPLHLVLVEEPEAHLHAQVQQAFIRRAYGVLRNHKDLKSSPVLSTQLVVSTHSSHVAHAAEFQSLRYFRRRPRRKGEMPMTCVHNLASVFGDGSETTRFATRYLKVTHCDLFFADAAVLVEGPAERMLVPFFIQNREELSALQECYVTWLEISGSHAHRLRPLIECLALPTLVVTDLDAKSGAGSSKEIPRRSAGQKTRNTTLKTWLPQEEALDTLLDLKDEKKVLDHSDARFRVRVAYQTPRTVTLGGKQQEAIPHTLEDAMLYDNLDLFSQLAGDGLIKAFRAAVTTATSSEDLAERVDEALKNGDKAELALNLLELPEPGKLRPPKYIADGLEWLIEELRSRQSDLDLPVPMSAPKKNSGEKPNA